MDTSYECGKLIIWLYLAGMSSYEVAERVGIQRAVVWGCLKQGGIPLRSQLESIKLAVARGRWSHSLSPEHRGKISLALKARSKLEEIERKRKVAYALRHNKSITHMEVETLYRSGISTCGIAQAVGLSGSTVFEWVRQAGLLRTQSEAQRIRKRTHGRIQTAQERAKKSIALTGRKLAPNDGHFSEGFREKMRMRAKEEWLRGDYVQKQMRARGVHPNAKELRLGALLQELLLPYQYVGDGEFILGGKCPDFLNTNGQKKLIELFGDYWHRGEDAQERVDYFKQYGFNTLIVWEKELKDEVKLKEKLLEYHHG